jgi:hypothetical protein
VPDGVLLQTSLKLRRFSVTDIAKTD